MPGSVGGDSQVLENLSPKEVFRFFEELTGIPRCSGNEKRVSDYLVAFAEERKLEAFQDEALNVVIRKPGTAGYEKSPAVIIQGHMDMVCEKAKGTSHDFSKDPLTLKIEGDFVRADGTTLGADNGLGVAYGLAILDSADIPHPPIELLVTTSEETGMNGAHALKADHLTGKTLLNIDAEEEGVLYVSCAGGVDLVCEFDTLWEDTATDALRIEISGLQGGHSGMEIIRQRANAIKLLGRILAEARAAGTFSIAAVSGGSKSNAIAREAQAFVTGDTVVLERVEAVVARFSKDLLAEFAAADPGIAIVAVPADRVSRQLDAASTARIIDFLSVAPNGVQSMSMDLEGLVESSLNLGVLTQSGESVSLTVSVRSSVDSIKEDIARRIEALADLVGAKVVRTGAYPGWKYEEDSKVRELCVGVYKEVTGHDAQIQAIHAGLECGLLKEKLPETDMIAFGPNLYNVHTPDEHLSIGSVANTWEFLLSVLEKSK